MEVRGRGERWLLGAQNSVPSAAVQKQRSLTAMGSHGTQLQSLSILPLKLLIGFYLVNL